MPSHATLDMSRSPAAANQLALCAGAGLNGALMVYSTGTMASHAADVELPLMVTIMNELQSPLLPVRPPVEKTIMA